MAGRSDESETEYIKEYFGNRPVVQEFDAFLVKVGDGDYDDVLGFHGIIPNTGKNVWRITRTYSESKPKGRADVVGIDTPRKSSSKSGGSKKPIRKNQYKRYHYNETKMSLYFRNQSRSKQISLDPFDGNEGVYSL